MIANLLIETTQITSYVILAVLVAGMVAMFVFSSRRRKKQEEDAKNLIDAVKPGNKVKTIGGICGIVVEVNPEENTFVLETGTEQSGKCFIKFDKQAIYQTDAVLEKVAQGAKEVEGAPESVAVEEKAELAAPVVEPAPAEQAVAEGEEKKPSKKSKNK